MKVTRAMRRAVYSEQEQFLRDISTCRQFHQFWETVLSSVNSIPSDLVPRFAIALNMLHCEIVEERIGIAQKIEER